MADILTKLCIISALLGIMLLVIVADKIDIPTSTTDSITKEDINKHMKIRGTIKKVINKESLSILEVQDKTIPIQVVLFKPNNNLKLEKNSFVEVYGKVSMYEDNIQIIAETIKKLN